MWTLWMNEIGKLSSIQKSNVGSFPDHLAGAKLLEHFITLDWALLWSEIIRAKKWVNVIIISAFYTCFDYNSNLNSINNTVFFFKLFLNENNLKKQRLLLLYIVLFLELSRGAESNLERCKSSESWVINVKFILKLCYWSVLQPLQLLCQFIIYKEVIIPLIINPASHTFRDHKSLYRFAM